MVRQHGYCTGVPYAGCNKRPLWKVLLYWGSLGGSENQSVTTICLTSPSNTVDQVVDCGLWNVGPLLFNGYAKLLDIGRNWNTLSYIYRIRVVSRACSMANMLNGWHVRWVCHTWHTESTYNRLSVTCLIAVNRCGRTPVITMLPKSKSGFQKRKVR